MSAENDRPLAGLSTTELALTIERLRGEVWKEITRIDGILDWQEKDGDRRWIEYQRALSIAEKELARRLDVLNHAHEEARSVLGTYVPRDVYERDKKEGEARLKLLEDAANTLAGKLWLPMLLVAGVAAGIAVAVVKLLFP